MDICNPKTVYAATKLEENTTIYFVKDHITYLIIEFNV